MIEKQAMKQAISLVLAALLLLPLGIALTACSHEHIFSDAWSKSVTHHWHACEGKECGEVADKAVHEWGDLVEDADGVISRTCKLCTVIETLPSAVSESKWRAAFDLGSNYTVVTTKTYAQGGSLVVTDRREGAGLMQTSESHDPYGNISTVTRYAEIVGEQFCRYTPSYGPSNELLGHHREISDNTVAQELAAVLAVQLPTAMQNYKAYAFNADSKRYEASEIWLDASTVVTDVSMILANGRLARVSYAIFAENETTAVSIVITYDDATVTFPTSDQIR